MHIFHLAMDSNFDALEGKKSLLRSLVKSAYKKNSYFSYKTYVVGTQKNRYVKTDGEENINNFTLEIFVYLFSIIFNACLFTLY